MPNHVTTMLTVRGTSEQVSNFINLHVKNDTLSLESFIPMPEELRNTTSPSNPPRDASELELKRWGKEQQHLEDTYGYTNWYDWANNNWGTKWDCYEGSMRRESDTEVSLYFQTAWDLPYNVFNKMFDLYPNMEFFIECVEEGGFFSGTIEFANGELFNNITDDEKTWREYASNLLGYELDEKGEIVY